MAGVAISARSVHTTAILPPLSIHLSAARHIKESLIVLFGSSLPRGSVVTLMLLPVLCLHIPIPLNMSQVRHIVSKHVHQILQMALTFPGSLILAPLNICLTSANGSLIFIRFMTRFGVSLSPIIIFCMCAASVIFLCTLLSTA